MKRMWKIIGILVLVVVVGGILLVASAMFAIHKGAKGVSTANDTPLIVLGCRVKQTEPSRILGERIDAAYTYLTEHPQAVAVLSGGQGEGESIKEAECMYRELCARGIDGERLYKEESSVNTQTNLKRSYEILENVLPQEHPWWTSKETAIATSEFHCYRGCLHAKQEGLFPVAVASKTGRSYVLPFYLREIVAVIYTWMFRS